MQREIKFKRTGSNSVYGSFAAGDVLRCDAALAAHYVSEGVARYTESAPEVVEPSEAQATASPPGKKKAPTHAPQNKVSKPDHK